MELALEQETELFLALSLYSFNPCFNGTCFRTGSMKAVRNCPKCFNPCFNGTCFRTVVGYYSGAMQFYVSILVLMELALER